MKELHDSPFPVTYLTQGILIQVFLLLLLPSMDIKFSRTCEQNNVSSFAIQIIKWKENLSWMQINLIEK
jgi:hypothetical protein